MIRKALLFIFAIVLVLVATVAFRWNRKFEAPYPALHASTDPSVIAAGRYIAYGPGHCSDCHTLPDEYATLKTGAEPALQGGLEFPGPTGTVRVPNITPDSATGIGRRTDGEIARILRYGVRADGRAAMPFMEYHEMSDTDLVRVISFLRSRPAVRHAVAGHDFNWRGKAVMAFVIRPIGPSGVPRTERGDYLVNAVANCAGCHTQRNFTTFAYTGPRLKGGSPMGPLVPPDITGSGKAGELSEQQFVERFLAGELIPGSPMPWQAFKRMTREDVASIYRYLKTL
jgi:mono/diheme cytochrome c family protein